MGIHASWGSGITELVMEHNAVPGDNGPMIRGLAGLFEDVIGEGNTVNVSALKGKEIIYTGDYLYS